jgi:hypothetical protein
MTTKTPPTLPDELVFEPDGHLGEAALACVADGETALVPALALVHLELCAHCTGRLGEAALLSMAAGEALRTASPAVAPAKGAAPMMAVAVRPVAVPVLRARRPLPVAAIAAALLLVGLTAVPALFDDVTSAPGAIVGAIVGAISAVPFAARMAASFLHSPWALGTGALAAKAVFAVVMMAVGLRIARATPRPGSLQAGWGTPESVPRQGGV